jgi:hypothetical protein
MATNLPLKDPAEIQAAYERVVRNIERARIRNQREADAARERSRRWATGPSTIGDGSGRPKVPVKITWNRGMDKAMMEALAEAKKKGGHLGEEDFTYDAQKLAALCARKSQSRTATDCKPCHVKLRVGELY